MQIKLYVKWAYFSRLFRATHSAQLPLARAGRPLCLTALCLCPSGWCVVLCSQPPTVPPYARSFLPTTDGIGCGGWHAVHGNACPRCFQFSLRVFVYSALPAKTNIRMCSASHHCSVGVKAGQAATIAGVRDTARRSGRLTGHAQARPVQPHAAPMCRRLTRPGAQSGSCAELHKSNDHDTVRDGGGVVSYSRDSLTACGFTCV